MPQLDFPELINVSASAKRTRRFRYLCGVRSPAGPLHVSDVSSELPPESFAAEWRAFLNKLITHTVINTEVEESPHLESTNPSKDDVVFGKQKFKQIGQSERLASPLQNLEIQVAVHKKRPFVPVRIVSFSEQKAYCKARLEGFWIGIELDRCDLEKLDLREGDSFEWTPRDDGKVFTDDIRSHPRKANPGEYERAERAFSELAKLRQESKR